MADMIDPSTITVVNSPAALDWPATATITLLQFGEQGQTRVEFTKRHGDGRWPDVFPPSFTGPIQFTLWLFRKVTGLWYGAGFIEFWESRDGSGSAADPDVPSRYHDHWFYGSAWSPIQNPGPIVAGEAIGFMVSSGDARMNKGPFGPQERSNIVVVPATDVGAFTFGDAPPVPVPSPLPPDTGDVLLEAIERLLDGVTNLTVAVQQLNATAQSAQKTGVRVHF
jgi:hypothetical protein